MESHFPQSRTTDEADDDFTKHSIEVMENEGGVSSPPPEQAEHTTREFYLRMRQGIGKKEVNKPFFVR